MPDGPGADSPALCCYPFKHDTFVFWTSWLFLNCTPSYVCPSIFENMVGWYAFRIYDFEIGALPFEFGWLADSIKETFHVTRPCSLFSSKEGARFCIYAGQLWTFSVAKCCKGFYNVAKVWSLSGLILEGNPRDQGCGRRNDNAAKEQKKVDIECDSNKNRIKCKIHVFFGLSSTAALPLPLT